MKKKRYHTALSIAGFDGSGGAGMQADLKTFSALGCYGMTVLTALPIQNTVGVRSIYTISEKCIEEQIEAIFDDIHVDAIKIGMLHRPEIIDIVAKTLKKREAKNLVLDPVMIAKSGDALLETNAINMMKACMFPLVDLITPNLPEASALLERKIATKAQMEQAAFDLTNLGPKAVIIKGGHLANDSCDDCLYADGECHWFSSPRVKTKNTHGTGCTFSAAVAAFLSKKIDVREAVDKAKQYIAQCIETGAKFETGLGNGPVHHFAGIWKA